MSLAPYASDPSRSRGRLHPEERPVTRGPRDAFQRDRDRIVHSIPFRRLRHKTQVFVAPDGDHFRVRLTHSLEVAQIGRAVARALGLNEDLTEALCLGHDLGHPPFGHAGEEALKAAMAEAGGCDHNAHTLRLLTKLECPYPTFAGLNLTWETLEGLAKHNGPVADPPWALTEADAEFALELASWPSLEAQVAAVADDIAYDNHDVDDGLRAGLFGLDELTEVPLAAAGWKAAQARYPDVSDERLAPELVRDRIGAMVNDVIAETRRAQQAGVGGGVLAGVTQSASGGPGGTFDYTVSLIFVAVLGNLDGFGQMAGRLAVVSPWRFDSGLPLLDPIVNGAGGLWGVGAIGYYLGWVAHGWRWPWKGGH